MRAQALDVCRIAGDSELASLAATSLTTILRMVAGGLGSTLLPEMAVTDEARSDDIAILPIQDPAPYRQLVLVFRPTSVRRRDLEAFAEIICRSVGKPCKGAA